MQRTTIAAVAASLALVACENPRPTEVTSPARIDGGAARAAVAWTVVPGATNLNYPRGIAFREGGIFVAEAGTPQGNTESTEGVCEQVPGLPGPGPWLGGATSRVSRIKNGVRATILNGLGSAVEQFGDVEGAADVAWVNGKLYVLMSVGCAHGHRGWPSSVIRATGPAAWATVSDLSTWLRANPTAQPEEDDFEPDGSWFSMINVGGTLYALEANQGNLISVWPATGAVTRIADVSATEGHVVPTALAWWRGQLLVTELRPFPAVPGSSEVLRYLPSGKLDGKIRGFTAVLGIDTDSRGNLYVLESFTCPTTDPCFPNPGSGRVIKIASNGDRTVIATGLSFATSLRTGPDNALYVSNFGYGPPSVGEIVRIALD